MEQYKYPVYKPLITSTEKNYVLDCLDSTWISSKGKYISSFENQFSKYVGADYSLSVCNGTAALHLAILALDIGTGDEVIVPTLTYIASVNSIAYTGATPVFADSVPETWQIDPDDIKRKLTSRTKAILVVHLYGHPSDMSEICAIAKQYNLFIIEDCAEAIGSKFNGKHVGTFGDIAAFSFFGNKTITTGEGGMVVTNNPTLHEKAFHFRGQGLAKNREYWHDVIGYNYRMTNICAAIGLAQLERLDEILVLKRNLVENYMRRLDSKQVFIQREASNVYHSYWMVTVLVEDEKMRNHIRNQLRLKSIETRPIFYPVHLMAMYSRKYEKYPVAENISKRGINLPSYPSLSERDVDFICESVNQNL